jgi:undecaprenyl pyrophosphate phosphatase UppP
LAATLLTGVDWIVVCAVVFLLFIQTIWSIVDCLMTKDRSTESKALWVLALVFLSCIANIIYGLFASKSHALRIATYVSFICIIVGLAIAAIFGKNTPPSPVPPSAAHKKQHKPHHPVHRQSHETS